MFVCVFTFSICAARLALIHNCSSFEGISSYEVIRFQRAPLRRPRGEISTAAFALRRFQMWIFSRPGLAAAAKRRNVTKVSANEAVLGFKTTIAGIKS